jgi:D-glycero-alpha-D-manno-heptose 1-phosphate guanylyltransferase
MKAVILAGGLGMRLRSEVPDLPKPLAPVAGKPFLAWKLDALDDAGFSEVLLSVGYRAAAIIDVFGNRYRRMALRYVTEDRPLGTGGALQKALATFEKGEPVWAMNGDTFLTLDYAAMRAQHGAGDQDAITMAVVKVEDASRYGSVGVRDGRVERFLDRGLPGRADINGGVYLLHSRLFHDRALPETFSFESKFLAPQVATLDIRTFATGGYFIDIGLPVDYARAQTELPLHAIATSSPSNDPSAE